MVVGKIIQYKYELLTCIGKGGTSQVYLAVDRQTQQKYAIKELLRHDLTQEMMAQFYTEATLLKQLSHEGLPKYFDVIEENAAIYLVMSYIDGETLTHYVEKHHPLKQQQVIEWGITLCHILSYLHHQSPPIVYQDIKPDNIMIQRNGQLVLVDFNSAIQGQPAHTIKLGTCGYASPEQYGRRHVDERSDVFALGMTLYFLLCGSVPHQLAYDLSLFQSVGGLYHKEWETIIQTCIALDPAKRYQSVEQVEQAIRKLPVQKLGRSWQVAQKYQWFKIGLALSGGLTLTLGSWLMYQETVAQQNYEHAKTSQNTERMLEAIDGQSTRLDGYDSLIQVYEEKQLLLPSESHALLSRWHHTVSKINQNTAVNDFIERLIWLHVFYYRESDQTLNYTNLYTAILPLLEALQERQEPLSKALHHIQLIASFYGANRIGSSVFDHKAFNELLSQWIKNLPLLKEMDFKQQLVCQRLVLVAIGHYMDRINYADSKLVDTTLVGAVSYYSNISVEQSLENTLQKELAFAKRLRSVWLEKIKAGNKTGVNEE